MPIRPVSAATWNRAMSGNRYNNPDGQSGLGGDVLADPAPRSHTPSMSVQEQQAAMAKIQQQKNLTAQKRMERLNGGGIAQQNMGSRPGTAQSRRPGSSRPGTGLNNMSSMHTGLSNPGYQQQHGAQVLDLDKKEHSEDESNRAAEVQRAIQNRGISTVYDPTQEEHSGGGGGGSGKHKVVAATNLDVSDMRSFLMQTGFKEKPIQCYIVRDRTSSKSYPKYSLYLNENDQFMMSARKRKKSKTSNYLISLDEEDTSRNSGNYFGKLRSNFVGTEFTIYDKGAKPGKGDNTIGVSQMSTRVELGAVMYQYNVMGVRGPRKMTALAPQVDSDGRRKLFRAAADPNDDDDDDDDDDKSGFKGEGKEPKDGLMVSNFKKGDESDMVVMRNKPPKWNDSLGAYCLNFNGRVTHASVKNFQLVSDNDLEHVILQFGKVGKDTFTMDYAHPICALQAFSMCLTSFDNKLACE